EGIIAGSIDTPRALTVWIRPEKLAALAAEEGILWIEEGPPPLTSTNDGARAALRVDTVQASGLTGSGVKLFVFDGGRVNNHLAFTGRLTYLDGTSFSNHATHVAGTAAGSGNGSPAGRNLRGMAPAATIYSAGYQQIGGTMLFWDNSGDIQADYAAARNLYGVDLATNSIGSNTAGNNYPCSREGDYGVSSSMIDGIVRGDNAVVGSPYITFWANGNERSGVNGRCGSNFRTTAEPSCAKNPIHIGATNSDGNSMTNFSSWGPCDDGRLKPIVSGPGCESGLTPGSEGFIDSTLPGNAYGGAGWCGTSMATPAVAGVAALAIQQYRSIIGNPAAHPLNALLKTWLIHTARDLGPDGPDYMYGYGEVDAARVIDLVKSPANYRTDTVTTGQTDTFSYQVPAGANQLKISLAWDDKAAAAFAATSLVNNLNLEVQSPGGSTTYYPFSLSPNNPHRLATANGANNRDNQEQIILQNPVSGTWTIKVKGAAVPQGPQAYALAYSHQASPPAPCSEAVINGRFEPGVNNWTLNGAARVNSPGTPPSGGSWSLRLGNADNTAHHAFQTITLPFTATTANLSFDWYMTTNEGSIGHGYDYFNAAVQTESGSTLGVHDIRSDGWLENSWQVSDNLDLSAYRGQTIRLNFSAATDISFSTAFYIDNVSLQLCGGALSTTQTSYLPFIIKNN
ncbi:MAG TPA: S8 family serine peptidase, partial [Anaerolineae bacterium]|nr:S8 family serine peptidase [Anaerolineae bacterium]